MYNLYLYIFMNRKLQIFVFFFLFQSNSQIEMNGLKYYIETVKSQKVGAELVE